MVRTVRGGSAHPAAASVARAGTVRPVNVRPLLPSDLDAVLALNNDNIPAVSELDRDELARLAGLSSFPLVVDVDGALGAYCLVLPPGVEYASVNYRWFSRHAGDLGYGSFAYLDRIAVAPAARRRGVARALYGHLCDALAGSAPVLFCEVNVRPRNGASLALHHGLGFREVGQQDTDGDKRVSLLALELR
jgi:predicted GNAT superfamily acetyltransferase